MCVSLREMVGKGEGRREGREGKGSISSKMLLYTTCILYPWIHLRSINYSLCTS